MNRKHIKKLLIFACIAVLTVLAWKYSRCDFSRLWQRRSHFSDLTSKMFPPDYEYFSDIFKPLFVTVKMALCGTALGAGLALLAAPLCASNMKYPSPVRAVLRVLVQILRSFPALILALFSTFIFGLGTFAGTAALTVFTFAIMTRLTYEDIEAASVKAFNAMSVIGTDKGVNFYRTVLPEILPSFLTNAIYLLETNVRHSAILGYVGAGGIGLILNEKISWREYPRVGTILISLFVLVCLTEALSEFLSGVVRGEKAVSQKVKNALMALFAAAFIFSLATTGAPDFSHTAAKILQNMAEGFTHPDLAFFFGHGETDLMPLILETICIAYLGTLLGTLPALLLAFLSSRIMPKITAVAFRVVIMAIRSVPFIIYGLIVIRVTGAGAFAGILTMGVCSIGLLTKRFIEAIDALDLRAYRALKSMGTASVPAVFRAVLPQLWPVIASSVLYRFDVNFREASVLGLVGAGGIGATLILAMNKYAWSTVGAIFIGTVIMVWVIDLISGKLRKKIG